MTARVTVRGEDATEVEIEPLGDLIWLRSLPSRAAARLSPEQARDLAVALLAMAEKTPPSR